MRRGGFYLGTGVVLAAMLAISGCLETKFTIGDKEHAAVDRGYVGDWAAAGNDRSRVIIRNLDDRQYYVEDDEPEHKPARMVGFITQIKSASFAQLRELPEDGSVPDKYLVLRVERKDDKLTLRQLNDKFFASQSIASSADLRHVIEENLENKEMYDGDPVVLTRQPRQ